MAGTTRTTTTKPSLMSRLRGNSSKRTTETKTKQHRNPLTGEHTTTTTERVTTHPNHTHKHNTRRANATTASTSTGPMVSSGRATKHHHQQRKPSMGDKLSGAMMKFRGSVTGRPGLKAAGTRREHGTDGRLV